MHAQEYRRVHPASYADFYTLGRVSNVRMNGTPSVSAHKSLKVFKMLWMESTTSKPNGSGKSKASSHVSFEKTAAGDVKEVRKFVVIANKGVYSKCM